MAVIRPPARVLSMEDDESVTWVGILWNLVPRCHVAATSTLPKRRSFSASAPQSDEVSAAVHGALYSVA